MKRLKTELSWVVSQRSKYFINNEMCQCGSEKVIEGSSNPERMRTSLLCLVFFNQFIYTHYQKLHPKFKAEFPIPKLAAHSGSAHAPPSWFVYKNHGYDKKADWKLIETTFADMSDEICNWVSKQLDISPRDILNSIEREILNEFSDEQQIHFNVNT